jgi:hypothetical protein
MSRSCPICHQPMKYDYSMVNEGTLGEESLVCPDGHYNYEFSYGYSRLEICGETWMYSYDQTLENCLVRLKEEEAVIQKNRMPTKEESLATITLDVLGRVA